MGTRRESVRLDLTGNFTPSMMKAAAATELLERRLDSLSRVSVQSSRTTANVSKDLDRTAAAARRTDASINQLTGRLRLLTQVATVLTPAATGVGAVGIAGLAGLANQVGVTALAAGTLVVAFQGVGDALKTVNAAALEPTTENLEKAREAMENLSPAAQDFVQQIQSMRPQLAALRRETQQGFFPGVNLALRDLERRLPAVERIFAETARTAGALVRDGGASLAGSDWDQFFQFLETDAQDSLRDLGAIIGNLTRGLAELWMAFDPLNDDFSSWARRASEDFASWADGLSQTAGFSEFVEYVQTNGPMVADTLSAFGEALVEVAEAASPLSGPVLQALEAVAEVVAAIADSDIGTPLIAGAMALATLNRALAVTDALSKRMAVGGGIAGAMGLSGRGAQAGGGLRTFRDDLIATSGAMMGFRSNMEATAASQRRLAAVGKSTGLILGLGVAASGAADKIGATNTASLGLMGTMGGFAGTIGGVAVGALMDAAAAGDATAASVRQADAAFRQFSRNGALSTNTQDLVDQFERIRQAREDVINDKGFGTFLTELPGVSKLPMMEDKDERLAALDAEEEKLNGLQGEWEAEAAARRTNLLLAAEQADGFNANRAALDSLVSSTQTFVGALQAVNSLLNNRASLRNYEAALDNLSKIAGRTQWNPDFEKGRENLATLDALVDQAVRRSETLKEQGRDLAAMKVLQRAIGDVEDFVAKTPAAKKAAAAVLAELRKLAGARAEPEIKVETKSALQKLKALRAELAKVDGTEATTRIITEMITRQKNPPRKINSLNDLLGVPEQRADGGTVPKTGLPYADRHHYLLADGEEVISNRRGQADRFRPLLKAINAAADGATVGGSAGIGTAMQLSFPGLARDYDMTARSLKGLRRALGDNEKALDKATSKRDAIASKRSDVMGAVQDKFTSQLFGNEVQAWSNKPVSPFGILDADIAGLKQFAKARKVLDSKGLDGSALDALFQQGSLQEIQAMAGMSRAELAKYEQKVELRDRLVGQQARGTGNDAYGAELAAANKELRGIRQDNRRLERRLGGVQKELEAIRKESPERTGQAVRSGINQIAKKGARRAPR